MVDLNDYLTLNSNVMVDLVNKKYVPAEMTEELIFKELKGLLMGFIVRDGSEEEMGKRDQVHNVLTMTMIYSLWCGWVSQAQTDRKAYMRGTVEGIKKSIIEAFEIGQRYAKDKP